MSRPSKVKFFFPQKTWLVDRTRLKSFIEKIFKNEGKILGGLNYVFCSDRELLKINREYLGHNEYTDIITFDLSESPAILGEIYISVNRVKDNSKKWGNSFTSELHRVIFHGVLHLCGYGDKNESMSRIMREKENFYLNQYFK